MREGDREKTDKSNKRKGTAGNPQISHKRPLQKGESRYGLEHGQSHLHRGQQVATVDQGSGVRGRGPETMNWDEGAYMHSHTWRGEWAAGGVNGLV